MTLADALAIVRAAESSPAARRRLLLACGFEPLHLSTFLRAHFAQHRPGDVADLEVGLFGDLEGTLASASAADADAAVVVLEWPDLDPRLGLRTSGGWGPRQHDDIVQGCAARLARLRPLIERLAGRMTVVLVPPTLSPSLLGTTTGSQWSRIELELQQQLVAFLADIAVHAGVHVLSLSRLAQSSPEAGRRDVSLELGAGFPWSLAHASTVAAQVIDLLYPSTPKKGLITDLDGTLWSGLVGEVGADAVQWGPSGGSQAHALYQQMLAQLSEAGVLLAIVSKNDREPVEAALGRDDLLVPHDVFHPVVASWDPKPVGVAAALQAWNLSADAVVFVDDREAEVEEVRSAFPEMTCLTFPSRASQRLALLEQLRDLFGKPHLLADDGLRAMSLRAGATPPDAYAPEAFLASAQGEVCVTWGLAAADERPLELINKTNQFNLNGRRLSRAEWARHLADPASVSVSVSYVDRFGPLGTIAVVAGRRVEPRCLDVSAWVMSCRAFARRIEHHTLHALFEQLDIDALRLQFVATDRNGPLARFLQEIGTQALDGIVTIERPRVSALADGLPHRVLSREAGA